MEADLRRLLAMARDIGRYTWFDLVSLPLARWVLVLAIPLGVLVLVMLVAVPIRWVSQRSSDPQVPDIAVVAADPMLGAEVVGWLEEALEVVAVAIPAGETVPVLPNGAVVVLGPTFAHDAVAEVLEGGEPADSSEARAIRERLRDGVIDRLVTDAIGAAPAVQVVRPDGSAVESSTEASWWAELFDPISGLSPGMVGAMLIFMVGGVIGSGVGGTLSQSERKGFNQVLGVGTSRVVIYLSELLTAVIFLGLQGLGLFGLYTAAIWVVSLEHAAVREAAVAALLSAPAVSALTVLALVQSIAAGCLVERMARDAPPQLRDRLVQVLALGFLVLIRFVESLPETVIRALAYAPLVGPSALWWEASQHGLSLVAIGAQIGWALGSIWLGSLVFSLDETPLVFVRRRLARLSAG